jgi:hypothetical protein
MRIRRPRKESVGYRSLAFALLVVPGCLVFAHGDHSKAENTPCFWQRDPDAEFDNEGRNHCAPVSIADGLVYLATTRGLDDLVDSTDHDGQIALITELAADMKTDPTDGTNPDKILTGLLKYAKKHGYAFERLELATWRGVSSANRKYKIGTKPALSWMTAAAKDPDVVEVFNFGWYKEDDDGGYTRHDGHWVNIVGSGPETSQFELHNPLLKSERQKTDTSITLSPLSDDFVVTGANGQESNRNGYYQAEGVGLPFNKEKISAAVLDSVIVFKVKKS